VGRRDTRPLLRSGNTEEILRTLAAKRNPVYALAHVHVTGNDAPHDLTVDKVIEALRK
jgi:shikimate kinase